mgnify:CR=1 FL=1
MTLNYANKQKLCKLFETRTSYCVGLNLVLGNVLTTMKVCKKWLLIQEGQKGVLSSSMKTTQTISLPMCRFLCSYKNIHEYINYIIPIIKISINWLFIQNNQIFFFKTYLLVIVWIIWKMCWNMKHDFYPSPTCKDWI